MTRVVGIRHRRKKTAEGEARPTTVAILEYGKTVYHDLETETDELDFLLGRFPIECKPAGNEDVDWIEMDLNGNVVKGTVRPHQCKFKKVSKEEVASCRANHIMDFPDAKGNFVQQRVVKVPSRFDGLSKGDSVAMVLGGSGDRFASALSKHGEEIGAEVFRIPPFALSDNRGKADKDDDHKTLVVLFLERLTLFEKMMAKDREVIRVKEALMLRMDAQRARISCELRLYQSLVGRIFLSPEGKYPEGMIEDQYKKIKASDTILQGLMAEEERRDKEMRQVVRQTAVWEHILEPVKGCGERIAAGLIASIGDVRRFAVPVNYDGAVTSEDRRFRKMKALTKTLSKVKAFCGFRLRDNVRFPRRRSGEVANWNPNVRQALFQLTEQFNRHGDGSFWGQKLLWKKAELRKVHPEPIEVEVEVKGNGKKAKKLIKRYTDGHIHKMACWWTATKFVEWLAREWLKMEKVYG